MGSPPKYSEPDEEQTLETHHLLSSPALEHSYPPTLPIAGDDDLPSVVYFYSPVYPAKGSNERLMGGLSRTREETITMIQSVITSLADVDRSRIQFSTLVNPDAVEQDQKWARILDPVWGKMIQSKPHTLKITLDDRPEDIKKRNKRTTIICLSVTGVALVIIALAIVLAIHNPPDHSKKS